ncbi:MAG TPA: BolA family protein [Beijerinckiaceae bacterium]|nr:BolA family protein [Beijerinckiaceae bacterium]
MDVKDLDAKQRMTAKLQAAFAPASLEVIDESHLHAGHLQAGNAKETHFRVKIVAKVFAGRSRLDRHRAVNGILAQDLANGVHALAIEARAPGE